MMTPQRTFLLCFCVLLVSSSVAFAGDDTQEQHLANLRGLMWDTTTASLQEEEHSNLRSLHLDAADQEEQRSLQSSLLDICRDQNFGFLAVGFCVVRSYLSIVALVAFCGLAGFLG